MSRCCCSCGDDLIMDQALERKLGCRVPVCSRRYVTAVLELDIEWRSQVERFAPKDANEDKK